MARYADDPMCNPKLISIMMKQRTHCHTNIPLQILYPYSSSDITALAHITMAVA